MPLICARKYPGSLFTVKELCIQYFSSPFVHTILSSVLYSVNFQNNCSNALITTVNGSMYSIHVQLPGEYTTRAAIQGAYVMLCYRYVFDVNI